MALLSLNMEDNILSDEEKQHLEKWLDNHQ